MEERPIGDMAEWASSITPEMIERRVAVGWTSCMQCGARARMYRGDPRARGWLRVECPNGHWYDQQKEGPNDTTTAP